MLLPCAFSERIRNSGVAQLAVRMPEAYPFGTPSVWTPKLKGTAVELPSQGYLLARLLQNYS